ncbi:MAG: amidohydrolase family protein [Burkholderiaceae bacterium]
MSGYDASLMRCHCCAHHRGGIRIDGGTASGAKAGADTNMGTGSGTRLPHFTVDLHCHLLVPAVEALLAEHPRKRAEADEQRRLLGAASFEHNQRMRGAIRERLSSPARRLQDMRRLGIDLQVLSPSPTQYYPWADAALAQQLVRTQNEAIAAVVRQHPCEFAGLGGVALQHPELAAAQLRDAVERLGLLGAEITSDPTGRGLDDPALTPFWAEAERLGAVIFLHPLGTSLGERVNRYYLSNIIGQPLETTIALSELIHGGVLDRFPSLKLCAAHGGGYLPFAVGRSDHGYGVRPEARGCLQAPSEYLSRLWFDTVVFRPQNLRSLIDMVGIGRIVAGTDYPFDMGEYALHDLVRAIPGLDDMQRAAVLGGNARRLLALPETHPALLAYHMADTTRGAV